MPRKTGSKRSLVDITLKEALKVLQLGEGFSENQSYQLRTKTNPGNKIFTQLYYVEDNAEVIAANFSDGKNAVTLCRGNEYYRTHYRIIKFLEKKGFDLRYVDSQD